jgi:hypothetical protein
MSAVCDDDAQAIGFEAAGYKRKLQKRGPEERRGSVRIRR